MISELGYIALSSALVVAIVQTVLPLIGAQFKIIPFIYLAKTTAIAQTIFVVIAYFCLSYVFVSDDFSVKYVALNSNRALPIYYKLSAVWSGHEGSLLLWVLILALWTIAVCFLSRHLPRDFIARVIAVMGFISIGFLLFVVTVSNPFERLFPIPSDGQDLNPLLQDPGLIFHPPLLYIGYVGFSVAFAFGVAALIDGKLDMAWARWTRPWTLLSWAFLTLGITLGSWWAYHELGWGGWWFWDPVENASFMPWLLGTALIHSLIISDKRDTFKSWTVLLAILAFSLSLLGTFLVRSGVLISVHAFASDPERGIFILAFLSSVIGISLALYAWRAKAIKSDGVFNLFSRESTLLVNNVFLLVSASCILLATLYPLLMDALDLAKISVGAPYYNIVFVMLSLPLVVLAGIGPLLQWKHTDNQRLLSAVKVVLLPALASAIFIPLYLYDKLTIGIVAGITTGVWVIGVMFGNLIQQLGLKNSIKLLPASFYGMTIAHIGLGIFVIGVTFTSAFSSERELALETGEKVQFADYDFVFEQVETIKGVNYSALQGQIDVFKDNMLIAKLYPEKRVYLRQDNPMTEASIHKTIFHDLYIALGDKTDDKWTMRFYYRPLVRWIWCGGLLIALGGFIAVFDKRYRRYSNKKL